MMQPLDPLAFLELARELADGDDEARLRTAVGRAYYALFLVGREKSGVRVKKDVHKAVVNAVKKRHRSLGDQLDSLRRLRIVADYELLPNDSANSNWQKNWERAEALVDKVLPGLQGL